MESNREIVLEKYCQLEREWVRETQRERERGRARERERDKPRNIVRERDWMNEWDITSYCCPVWPGTKKKFRREKKIGRTRSRAKNHLLVRQNKQKVTFAKKLPKPKRSLSERLAISLLFGIWLDVLHVRTINSFSCDCIKDYATSLVRNDKQSLHGYVFDISIDLVPFEIPYLWERKKYAWYSC